MEVDMSTNRLDAGIQGWGRWNTIGIEVPSLSFNIGILLSNLAIVALPVLKKDTDR